MALSEDLQIASRDRKSSVLSSSNNRTFITPRASWPTRRIINALMQNVTHRQMICGEGIRQHTLRSLRGKKQLTWKMMLNDAFWMLLCRMFLAIMMRGQLERQHNAGRGKY